MRAEPKHHLPYQDRAHVLQDLSSSTLLWLTKLEQTQTWLGLNIPLLEIKFLRQSIFQPICFSWDSIFAFLLSMTKWCLFNFSSIHVNSVLKLAHFILLIFIYNILLQCLARLCGACYTLHNMLFLLPWATVGTLFEDSMCFINLESFLLWVAIELSKVSIVWFEFS